METEVVDEAEFALLEAVCLQAEQNSNQSTHETKSKKARFVPSCLAPLPPAPPLPILLYRGQTTYCREVAQIDRAAAFLLAIGTTVSGLGFDIEWTVTYQTGKPPRPIALMQFCVVDPSVYNPYGGPPYHCFLLHINRRNRTENKNIDDGGCGTPSLPPKLIELLTSETVRKAGVGIHGDSLKLERDYSIKMKGLIDLSEAANARLCSSPSVPTTEATAAAVAPVQMPQKWSMTALTEKLMNGTVNKSQSIRCSDWEQDPLTAEQQRYASTDAWISLRLHEILSSMPITWQPAAVPNPMVPGKNLSSKGVPAVDGSVDKDKDLIISKIGIVPACKEPAALQPAKLAVLQQHFQGIEVADIAAQRQIQPSTVQSYLAEAIIAGYAYNWGRFCVKDEVVSLSAKVANEAGVIVKIESLQNENLRENAAKRGEYTPRDVLNEVLAARNIKIRALFEEMEGQLPGMGFGDLRLAFAHLGRLII